MRTTMIAAAARRTLGVAVATAALAGSGSWAYAAETGVERTGTWLALAAALAVALLAGVAAVVEPRGQAAAVPARAAAPARAMSGPVAASRLAQPSAFAPAPTPAPGPVPSQAPVEEDTPTVARRYFADDDTMMQRALAAETKARRAQTDHRGPSESPRQG